MSSIVGNDVEIEKLENRLSNISIKEIKEHPTKSKEDFALELFELASEKERVGKLNDAADYYWKAFKLDDKVDLKYRQKYFENLDKSDKKLIESKQINTIKDAINNNNSDKKKGSKRKPLELNKTQLINLLDSYSTCELKPLDEEQPLLINSLPYEILLKIMETLLIEDTPSWINFSLVCKKLAYIGFRDKNIWSNLCKLIYNRQSYIDNDEEKFKVLIKQQWGIDNYKMLNERPFIKFRGVYISKVSYMKEGARSENSNSWNLPYRIITYYRYYRFYADGTCLKIITILEPSKVIKRLYKGYNTQSDEELIKMNETAISTGSNEISQEPTPVSAFINRNWLTMYSGTYKISLQGDVETDCNGPVQKYRFIDKFKITNTGKYHRHNKLEWVDLGFYDTINRTHSSLNRDNEKDFVFSRVNSYQY